MARKVVLLCILTFLDEQVGESEHHSVSAVEEVSTHEMGVCNGQTTAGNQRQNSLDLCL